MDDTPKTFTKIDIINIRANILASFQNTFVKNILLLKLN